MKSCPLPRDTTRRIEILFGTRIGRKRRGLESHTIAKHKKKKRDAGRKLYTVIDGNVFFCGGTCMSDWIWPHLKGATPKQLSTYKGGDRHRILEYAGGGTWGPRRQGKLDLFKELGKATQMQRVSLI